MNAFSIIANQQKTLLKGVAKKIPGVGQLKQYLTNFPLLGSTSAKPRLFDRYMIRPFTLDDLKSAPEGWYVGEGPDFVGIAAMKAGTSWWYYLLMEHPQIVQNRSNRKELHYFHHVKYFGLNDEQILTYRMAFAAPEGSICGEWTPAYLSNPFCIEYLKAAAPDAKILVLLRNPVDRLLSALNHKSQVIVDYYDFNPEQRHVYEVFDMTPIEIASCFYAVGLQQLLRYFGRDQILVLQYEKCKSNPLQEIARTYRFLGVDDQYQPKDVKRPVYRREYSVSPLKTKERQRLKAYFADDVYTLSELFPEIDLSLWPDFAD